MEIIKEREMKLLSRKRVVLMIDNNGATPSRQELIKQVAAKFKVKEDLVIIKHVYQQFGKNKTKLMVHIYKDKKKKDMFEHKSLLKKHEDKPEPKPEEAPAEEKPPEEPPTEEEKAEEAEEEVDKKLDEASEEKVEEEKPAEDAPEEPAAEEKKDD